MMKVMRQDNGAGQPDHSPIFIGEVTRQSFVRDEDAELLRVNAVTFHDGAYNKWHHHAADQVLVITDGEGIVATREQEYLVAAGDVVLVPAGESHWHGAQPGKAMTHLSILTPGPLTIEE